MLHLALVDQPSTSLQPAHVSQCVGYLHWGVGGLRACRHKRVEHGPTRSRLYVGLEGVGKGPMQMHARVTECTL